MTLLQCLLVCIIYHASSVRAHVGRLYCSPLTSPRVLCAVESANVHDGKVFTAWRLSHLISHITELTKTPIDEALASHFSIGPLVLRRTKTADPPVIRTIRHKSGSCPVKYGHAIVTVGKSCLHVPGLVSFTGDTLFSLPKRFDNSYACEAEACAGMLLRRVTPVSLPSSTPPVKIVFKSDEPEVTLDLLLNTTTSSMKGTITDVIYVRKGLYLDEETMTVGFSGSSEANAEACRLMTAGSPTREVFGQAVVFAVEGEYILFLKRQGSGFIVLREKSR